MKYDVKQAGMLTWEHFFPLKHRLSEFENWPAFKKHLVFIAVLCIVCKIDFNKIE